MDSLGDQLTKCAQPNKWRAPRFALHDYFTKLLLYHSMAVTLSVHLFAFEENGIINYLKIFIFTYITNSQ